MHPPKRGPRHAAEPDVADHAQLVEELELLRDVRIAVKQIESGKGMPHREAKAELRRRFRTG